MRKHLIRAIAVVAALSITALGCAEKSVEKPAEKPVPAAEKPTPAPKPAAEAPAPKPAAEAPAAPAELSADEKAAIAKKAEQEITEENVEDKAEELLKEIEADLE